MEGTTKHYGYNTYADGQAIIFEVGSKAHEDIKNGRMSKPDTEGVIVGTSEWAWLSEENGRRICAALEFFHGIPTDVIETLVRVQMDLDNN